MDLGQWIMMEGPLPPEQAVGWALRLVKTVEGLHQGGVVHGNISPEVVETIDRDCSAPAELTDAEPAAADPQYQSADRARGALPSEEDDVWAVGVFLYYLATRAVPFAGERPEDVASRIEWRPASPIEVFDVDAPDVQGVLDQVFAPEPAERIKSAATLRRALYHCAGGDDELPSLKLSEPLREALVDAADSRTHHHGDRRARPKRSLAAARDEADAVAATAERRPRPVGGSEPSKAKSSRAASGWDLAPWLLLVAILVVVVLIVTRGDDSVERAVAPVGVGPTGPASTQPLVAPTPDAPRLPPGATSHSRRTRPAPSTSSLPTASAPASATASHERAAKPEPTTSAASPSASPAKDVSACVVGMFPKGTFADLKPGFDFVCEAAEAHEGAEVIRSRVVWARKGRQLTEAMREWSQLGWYDMAAFALIQSHCCQSSPDLRAPVFIATCKIEAALAAVKVAAKTGDRKTIEAALERYTIAVRCAAHSGAGAYFGHSKAPTRAGRVILERLLERLGSRH